MTISLIIVISTITFFRNITNFPLRNWDEAWYAEIIKNMASGKYGYLMPFWNGRYYFDHEPLYFWLSAPIVKLFGPGEWQVRFVSAVAAVTSTVLIFLIGKKIKDEKLGFFSAVVFLTMGQVVIRFAHGNLDSLLTALFLASFYFYLKSVKQKFPYSIFLGITLGLGMLVKSWGIGLFPLFLIFIYSFTKNNRLPKNLTIIIPIALAAVSLWYIPGFLKFGNTFISWYLFNPSEGRLSTPFQNFSLSYFKALIRDIGFWFIPIFLFALTNLKKIKKPDTRLLLPLILVSLTYIFFLNFLKDKSDWYNIPAYPLIAIIVGYLIHQLHTGRQKIIYSIIIFVVILLQIYNINRIENIHPDRSHVGAELGIRAKNLIPQGSNVILDDPDFTSFLYYSNQEAVYTLEDNQKSEFAEWWKIKHEDLPNFVKDNTNVWVVTPNVNSLPAQTSPEQIINSLSGYNFIKLN
ncbi:hypothetical protein A3A60_01965 [Candidatus Curtissbacteria bacterium RIFCSPLOWO2_01_FULL_42_26]|uniref:Glycosyltransferase RgtA/B/C/D-like domain-containing protein n=1 Tax=Candidatus Curtissbacteria bacterium RIFCSPLOWO2_01_FULL_42_26 TaxID=1797729 RepID=A0A1F5I4P7_9BACT|nr:MAG: hypothetical protein A3A60_01965 [Candidatus Curtissbacteria bacterium RIFCSPLOWO2_01_FULL_42_26]